MSQETPECAPDDQSALGFTHQLKVLVGVLGLFFMLAAVVSSIPKESNQEGPKNERAVGDLKAAVVIFEARLNKLDAELDQFLVEDQGSKDLDGSNQRMAKYLKMNEKTQKVMADMLRFFEEFTDAQPNIDEDLLRELWSPLVTKIESIQKRQNAVHSEVQDEAKKAEADLLNQMKKGE